MNHYLQLVREQKARKRFGQNFLIDLNIITKLVQNIGLKRDDVVVEIGPGLGGLTRPVLKEIDHITVIELDRDLIPILSVLSDIDIVNQDVLTFDFTELRKDDKKIRVIGNLPYNISTPIIFHLLKYCAEIQDMHFMLQKEVVERITATPDDSNYGRLSVMVQRYCKAEPLILIAPNAFDPAPKVMSQFMRLIPYEGNPFGILSDEDFYELVKMAFSMKRKTLKNNLKSLMTEAEILSCDIDPSIRAEKLPIEAFTRLANYLTQKEKG